MHKKILITSNLYKPNIGGIENSLYFMAKSYIKAGFEVHIVASTLNHNDETILPLYEEREDIKIFRYPGKGYIKRKYHGIKLYKKLLNENKYENIISRTHDPVIMLWLAGAKNISYILAGVSLKQNKIQGSVFSIQFLKRIIPHLTHHTVQFIAIRIATNKYVFSNNMIEQIRKYLKYNDTIDIIKPGIETNKFRLPSKNEYHSIRNKLGFLENDLVIIGVGRFEIVKGFEYLIKSLVHLPSHFKLLLIGDGSERSRYNDLISQYKLENRIKLIGPVQDTSMFYRAADIYVLSSTHETLGQTILEALASGLPIVAFDNHLEGVLTATSEITDKTNSVYVTELSEKALAEGIYRTSKLIKSNFFSRVSISKAICTNYSWDKMIRSIR